MGVPGFFKWLAQRYPLICETYRGSAAEKDDAFKLLRSFEADDSDRAQNVPEGFDNLYIDVNGIIHNCSHSVEELCQGIRCEEDIFVLIFQYINSLVKIVRPRKLLYLAVDGVAPRAKIMQQRERRFRSARDSKHNDVVFKAVQEELGCDDAQPKATEGGEAFKFDPIQITPGTPFMERLSVRLQFFANMMINDHKAWKDIKIVVSGSDVPGEGEHKIAEYIRNNKAQRHNEASAGGKAHYVSHCIYGLDADLILLSLATHEPYICLIREQIYFTNRQTSSRMMMNMNDYIFLHIGILREYILNDLIQPAELRRSPQSIDRVVDDFVLMSMFVGNDFLPHGKFSKIADGGFNHFINYYIRYVERRFSAAPRLDFWLVTGCGEINYENLKMFLGNLVKHEASCINSELGGRPDDGNKSKGRSSHKSVNGEMTVIDVENCRIATDTTEFMAKYGKKPKLAAEWKARYYFAKMGIASDVILLPNGSDNRNPAGPPLTIGEVVHDYLEGIQWVMYYYYRGVPSWSWYLRCKYAPLLTDVQKFLKTDVIKAKGMSRGAMAMGGPVTLSTAMSIKFALEEPCTPYEQLMMILPPDSSYLLPSIFANLITNKESPLHKYYPEKFDIDMDDTNVPWGGVTLLPVVPFLELRVLMNYALLGDEVDNIDIRVGLPRKLYYMESRRLTEDEKCRNNVGIARIYFCNPESRGTIVNSPMTVFGNIIGCKVEYEPFFNPALKKGQTFPTQLMMSSKYAEDAQTDRHLGDNIWFPSLSTLPFTPFTRSGVNVFQIRSHLPSIYLWIRQPFHHNAVRNLITAAKAKYVTVGYPYQHIGRLEAIWTPYVTIRDGHLHMGKPQELVALLTTIRQNLAKRGVIVSHKSPEPSIDDTDYHNYVKMSRKLLYKLFDGLPGCGLSNDMQSVRSARSLKLDLLCENVVVEYRVVDINLQDTERTEYSLLAFVRFIEHVSEGVPQMERAVVRDKSSSSSQVELSNNLNEMIALKNAIVQHEMLYGKYSKPLIKAVCIMKGSLYGCVGTIERVGNSFDNISAIFSIPDYRVTIAENALQMYQRHQKITHILEAREEIRWHSFDEICRMAKLCTTTASAIFHLLACGKHASDIGMHLALWSDEKSCVMCLPGYTRCSDTLLTAERMSNPDSLLRGVEYSSRVVALVEDYRANFPELFHHLGKNAGKQNNAAKGEYRHNVNLDAVFVGSPELVEYRKGQLAQYVSSQVFRRLKLTIGNYCCLSPSDIESVTNVYDETPDSEDDVNCKLVRVSHIRNLHIPSYNTGTVFAHEDSIRLGQCVVYINHNEVIPLGARGTVVGIYPQNSSGSGRLFEVLLERTFVGATDLFGRCGMMRGIIASVADILPLYDQATPDQGYWSMSNQSNDRENAHFISYV
ncbi:hypothetical protein BOVATA_023220 [Babesia ovata]|uniref:Uncharacterized protein n=1 Tax=Babesia ovata TaxID=189622 RepID=A0A2H6KCY9_9APIC|nr:uncharacterized protein BOVATA_023220 [Babesia ovata]GBE60829.1 hypothetical protein BOVATA_023220 [Babesia ovata]